MDTIRKPEEEQAEMLRWHLESVVRGGVAGTIFFAWTDEWFSGGQEITDWAFGLVRAIARRRRPFHRQGTFRRRASSMTRKVKLPRYPKVSVIVCSYNGGKTLDDASNRSSASSIPTTKSCSWTTDRRTTRRRSPRSIPWVVNIRQENMGLSFARNVGAQAATGEIFAYTDSDCMADPDWLYYMVGTLLSGDLRRASAVRTSRRRP